MPDTTFTLSDLMTLLSEKAGLPTTSHTTFPDARFTAIRLDSLAFIILQTELQDRLGTEMHDDSPDRYTLGEIVERINAAQSSAGMA